MSKPRPWPNNALTARDEAVCHARHGQQKLQAILDGEPLTQTDLIRRVALVVQDLLVIETLLVGAGAPERKL